MAGMLSWSRVFSLYEVLETARAHRDSAGQRKSQTLLASMVFMAINSSYHQCHKTALPWPQHLCRTAAHECQIPTQQHLGLQE